MRRLQGNESSGWQGEFRTIAAGAIFDARLEDPAKIGSAVVTQPFSWRDLYRANPDFPPEEQISSRPKSVWT